MFRKVLIANRGEIAVRIIRTLREMGVTSVAAFSDADSDALFVREADESYRLGPAQASESYLNIDAILAVCQQAAADAVHPGYGFLAENPEFAEAVRLAGFSYIGPPTEAIRRMGNKVQARRAVADLDVPVVPGTERAVRDVGPAREFVRQHGLPVVVKAAGGGGGRGMRVVREESELGEALEAAGREAQTYFGDRDVYLERYFDRPRHVEIQVLGDGRGNLVHLGERDCSLQRRHQKLIEEAPAPGVDLSLRRVMGEAAIRIARSVEFTGAGTVEFLMTDEKEFYFLEMNTRIQVEHPVTEEVSGVDIVREMVMAAAGEPLSVLESLDEPHGHSIEVRINAEDPMHRFRPTPAKLSAYIAPGGPGTRVDSGVYAGYTIPQHYDSLMAKLIVWAPDRELARSRALRALREYRISGPATTIDFSRAVLGNSDFVAGKVDTGWVERSLDELTAGLEAQTDTPAGEPQPTGGKSFEVEVNRRLFQVQVSEIRGTQAAVRRKVRHARPESRVGALTSPMHGTVIAVSKQPGEKVAVGDTVAVIEAMKMENEIPAHRSGTIAAVSVRPGDPVEMGQQLATIA